LANIISSRSIPAWSLLVSWTAKGAELAHVSFAGAAALPLRLWHTAKRPLSMLIWPRQSVSVLTTKLPNFVHEKRGYPAVVVLVEVADVVGVVVGDVVMVGVAEVVAVVDGVEVAVVVVSVVVGVVDGVVISHMAKWPSSRYDATALFSVLAAAAHCCTGSTATALPI